MSTTFFHRGGKSALKIVRPPKMALGEGILYTLSLFFYFGQMTASKFFRGNDIFECRENDFFFKLSSFWLFGKMTTLIFRGSAATPFQSDFSIFSPSVWAEGEFIFPSPPPLSLPCEKGKFSFPPSSVCCVGGR